ncbi:MAG TPA: THUMP domain-containing protein [Thermoanaerobaculia bacterium]|nr:THUMP domain-containing protein [Thermoanaerobaculia bacterium]
MPRGVEDLAAEELRRLGAADLQPTAGGISFTGDLAVAYRVLLESRLASRLLLPLWRVEAATSQVFYNAVSALPWERQLRRGATFAVDARARGDRAVHTHFVALRTKDAIVDRLRERWGERPDVDVDDPALRIHVLLDGGEAQLSIDLSGEPLHRRGYRGAGGPAPLKENVAAAMLLRAGWPAIAAAGGGFVDPMCGAGTLLVEAALLATDVAPGLLRTGTAATFGLRGWVGHDRRLWESLRAEAERRRQLGRARLPPMVGSDRDAVALDRAQASLAAAGIEGVELEQADVGDARPPRGAATGLVATNAPYGHRIGGAGDLPAAYRRLGEALKARFDGWRLALLTADAALAGEVRMRPARRNALWNGGIRCELLQYSIGRAAIPGREAFGP